MRRSRVTWTGVLTLAACAFEPEGAQRFEPPPIYREWFANTEACSALRGDYFRIDWFVVPGPAFACPSGQCVAHWHGDHSIFVAERFVDAEMVVRHEMLHDIIGRPGHPDPPFVRGCGLTWTSWSGAETAPEDRQVMLDIRHSAR